MTYQVFTILRRADGAKVGSVQAQSADEALRRMCNDATAYIAVHNTDGPMAAPGLTSYRYAARYGHVMIGARDDADALREASRSITGEPDRDKLEVWCGERCAYQALA